MDNKMPEDAIPEGKNQAAAKDAPAISEHHFRRLLDVLPDAIVLYDLQGRVIYANDSFLDLYGWSRGEFYGKRIDFVPPSEIDRTAEAISRSLTGESVRLVGRRLTKDGRLVDILIITTLMKDDTGKNVGIYVIHRDLTERRAMQAALEESQQMYRTLLDASPDPISVYSAEGKVTYINPAFESTFGWTIKELLGKGIDFVPKEAMEATMDAVRRTLEGASVELETQRLTKSGQLLDVHLKTAVLRDSDGKIAGDIVLYRDITERKKIERELKSHRERLTELVRERTAALTESRGRFRELAEMLPEIIFEIDMESHLLFVNRRALEIFGLTDEEEKPVDLASMAIPEDRDRMISDLTLRMAGKGERNAEYTFQAPGGKAFPGLAISDPMMKDGRIVGLRGIIVDLSARKSMEEQLRQATKMEAVGTLAGGIAHDFNNILQAILGQVQLLQSALPHPVDTKERLNHIEKAVERASGLVRQLLAFGRRQESSLKTVSVNREIKNILEILDRTIPKMISVKCELDPSDPSVIADQGQIAQILLNLSTNARDAMPDGGELNFASARYTAGSGGEDARLALTPGEYVELRISDTGTGMDGETLERMYEPFFTTKDVGKGSGLGLSTVYGIVKSHGGQIICDSAPGLGTTFKVYLPLAGMGTAEEPAAEKPVAPPPSKGEETILVADDDETIIDLAKAILEHLGYKVATARSGEEALEIFASAPSRFDLVILDLGMPGMGGRKCMEEILRLKPGEKVLIASGYSEEREARGIIEAGAFAFVPKPYRMGDLGMKVRTALDQGR